MTLGIIINIIVFTVILLTEGCMLLPRELPVEQQKEYWTTLCDVGGTRIIVSNEIDNPVTILKKCP